jgi:murein DD-endopeptidase MepM/ murein hydrolase activator NlpD
VCVFVAGFIINLLSQQSGKENELPPSPAIASVPVITPVETAEIPAVPVLPEPQYVEISGRINSGDTFSKALARQEQIPSDVKHQIIQSLSSCLDFRQLKPGDKYSVTLDEDNKLVRCTYEAGPLQIYVVENKGGDDGGYAGRKESIALEVKTTHFAGEMRTSLFEAFLEIEENSKLVYAFADIFASQIDFNTEPRQHDRFEGVVEKIYKNNEFIGYGNIIYAKYEQQDGSVHEGFLYRGTDGRVGHFNRDGEELGTFFIKSPLPVGRVTSRFTWRRKHPITGVVKPHLGIDLAAPTGTPVMAASDGKVAFIGVNGGYGKQVILSHNGGYKTYYGHLSRYGKGLKKGSRVNQKQIIGYVGSTGVSTGPHLDYRMKSGNQFLDPFGAKFKPRSILSGDQLAAFQKESERISLFVENREHTILSVEQRVVQPEDTLSIL